MKRLFTRVFLICWHGIATVLIGLALMLVLARFLLPLAGDYRENFASLIGDYLGVPVHVEALSLTWEGSGPRLQIEGLTLLDTESGRAQVRVQRGLIRLGFARPLWGLNYSIREIGLVGVPVHLVRNEAGRIRVTGLGQPVESAADPGPQTFAWLLEAQHLRLLDTFIELRESDGRVIRLSGLDLQIDNEDTQHRLQLEFDLPGRDAAPIRLLAEFQGEPGQIETWHGESYLQLQGADFSQLRELVPRPDWLRVSAGAVDLRLWTRWDALSPVDFVAELGLWQLRSAADPSAAPGLQSADLRIGGRVQDGRWRIASDRFELRQTDGRRWSVGRVQIDQQAGNEAGRRWRVLLDTLALADLSALADVFELPSIALTWWQRLRPTGRLDGLWLGLDSAGISAAGARMQDLESRRYESIPALAGLDGWVAWDGASLDLQLDSRDVRVEFAELFRDPIELLEVAGGVNIRAAADGLRIRSRRLDAVSRDIATRSRLDFSLAPDGGAFLDMQSSFRDGDASRKSRYLPVGIMVKPVIDWLDQGVLGGRIVTGGLLFHGRLDEFPFHRHEGVFDVDLQVRDAQLRYLPEWPTVDGIDARVRFYGPSLRIDSSAASVLGAELGPVEARIDNLGEPVVQVSGQAHGRLSDYIAFINQSPLRAPLGAFFGGAEARGSAPLRLSLRVPLSGSDPVAVNGVLALDGQHFSVADFDLDLRAMRGDVHFTESTLRTDALQAETRGSQAKITAATIDTGTRRILRFNVDGRFDARQLLPHVTLPLEQWLVGAAPWKLAIEVPVGGAGNQPFAISVSATSDLRGTAIEMPAPLGKTAAHAARTVISTRISADEAQTLTLAYGPKLRALIELAGSGATTNIARAAVSSDSRIPELPLSGIVVHGQFGAISFDDWLQFAASMPAGESVPLWQRLIDTSTHIDAFRIGDLYLSRANFRVAAGADHLAIRVDSDQLAGVIEWPFERGGRPLRADLERLDLKSGLRARAEPDTSRDGGGLDPRNLPSMVVDIETLLWEDAEFKNVEVLAQAEFDGLRFNRIQFRNEHLSGAGTGAWQIHLRPPHEVRGERSHIDFKLDSDDLDAAMRSLGYFDALREGKGTLHGRLGWDGAIVSPSLASMHGSLRVDFRNGRLISVDPGMGRIFGLFSLQALPRRLSLDFKDFIVDGFSYDRIRGDLNIAGGQAVTDNLVMAGPAANVHTSGRTGLISRDYDQEVVVRPHLASSLPIVGALASGPAAGLAVLLVEQLFSGLGLNVEDIGKVTYTLTGSWDQPRIEKVEEEIDLPDFTER